MGNFIPTPLSTHQHELLGKSLEYVLSVRDGLHKHAGSRYLSDDEASALEAANMTIRRRKCITVNGSSMTFDIAEAAAREQSRRTNDAIFVVLHDERYAQYGYMLAEILVNPDTDPDKFTMTTTGSMVTADWMRSFPRISAWKHGERMPLPAGLQNTQETPPHAR